MDHGLWPAITTKLYIEQTGDYDILKEENTYFKDNQLSRTIEKDSNWTHEDGCQLKDINENIYKGSLIEHILVEHLLQFFNVGEHNNIRLESADWNDGLDMAFDRGESVAFSSIYAGNLIDLAHLLEDFSEKGGVADIEIAEELMILLDSLSGQEIDYENPKEKKKLLFDGYFKSVEPQISGRKIKVKIIDIVNDLERKGKWIFEHIKNKKKVKVKDNVWFNGYYDNNAEKLEGVKSSKVWMTLTGQVFPIMSGLADDDEIKQIIASVNNHLKDDELGGLRLNTDFGLKHYLDLGRAFGFAYGTKENGSFFSHMNVM